MRSFALVTLLALTSSALAAPFSLRQLGDVVNGPTAINEATVNNGQLAEGVLDTKTSFDNAQIIGATGNTIETTNSNKNIHGNAFLNAKINVAQGVQGSAVVGNGNKVFDAWSSPALWAGPYYKRQLANALSDIDSNTVNSGALSQGTLKAGLSLEGASMPNSVGNDVTQVSKNQEIADSTFVQPTFNEATNNDGPVYAGNNGFFMPVNNEKDAIHIDNGAFFASALAGYFGPAPVAVEAVAAPLY
ncbi:hypothetical protein LPJ66_002023 [Kickxella alabastrina]|uniref:Uncharacterized protein n=1 Tax=Kickxella alabastrina TaxID=61397 RepID=A0ACC1IRK3_9FUNG|nr:hypothetical protein LPJ66_002023 [Kickxella alabastrina]